MATLVCVTRRVNVKQMFLKEHVSISAQLNSVLLRDAPGEESDVKGVKSEHHDAPQPQ